VGPSRTRSSAHCAPVFHEMQASPDQIRLLEELSFNALPSLETEVYDGWLLRFANGLTQRANSVQTLHPGERALAKKIDYCEDAYGSRSLIPLFKLTDVSQPKELDAELAARGYTIRTPVSVQTAPIRSKAIPQPSIRIEAEASAEWMDCFSRIGGLAPEKRPTFEAILSRIAPKKAFAGQVVDGQIAALGLAVLEDGWVGLFDIVTAEGYRRLGHATAIIEGLLAWANENDAKHTYLQVTKTNRAALALYERLEFREAYTYWYREKKE
jgi:N-acetylglutamate synthase